MDPPEAPPSPHTPPKQKGIPGAPLRPRPRRVPGRKCDLSFNIHELPRSLDKLPLLSSPSTNPSEVKPRAMLPPPPRLHRREGQYQEMLDDENPRNAQQERDAHFNERLPHVQLVSCRLQSHLEIFDPEVWPTPRLPDSEAEGNDYLVEINTKRVQDALDDCKDYAFKMDRESSKGQFLDEAMRRSIHPQRATAQAGRRVVNATASHDEDEINENPISEPRNVHFTYTPTPPQAKKNKNKKKNKRTKKEDPNETDNMMSSGLSHAHSDASPSESNQGQTTVGILDYDGDETLSDYSGIPPCECPGFSPAPSQSLASSVSAQHDVNDAEAIAPVQNASMDSPAEPKANASTISMPHSEDFDPPPSSDEEAIPSATHIQPSEQGPTQSEIDLYNEHLPAIHAAWVADDNDSTQSHKDCRWANAMTDIDFQPGYDSDGNSIGMDEWNRRYGSEEEEEKEDDDDDDQNNHLNAPMVSSDRAAPSGDIGASPEKQGVRNEGFPGETQGKGKGEKRADSPTFEEKLANVPQSQGMDFLKYAKEEFKVKVRTRNPTVPQPQNMPGTLTEALCNWHHLQSSPILTLTLEDVSVSMLNPKVDRCVLLQHFEVGLDGVEAIIRGQVIVPETVTAKAEREERLQKLGTRKVGDGGYYNVLKKAQEDISHGKGWWLFCGVRFKRTKTEKKLRKPAKWLFFGAPMEAIDHLAVPPRQQRTIVLLGGGPGRAGATVGRYPAEMKRSQLRMCKGGIAPIDAWPGALDWQDGVLRKVQDAMADNGLRVTFLFEDRTRPQATLTNIMNASNIAAKKRKEPSAEMTAEEEKEMGKKIAQCQKPDVGRMIADEIREETAKQNAQREERGGAK